MKRCPECGREYDNTMMFCLDDGAELLYGPAIVLSEPPATAAGPFGDQPATAILHGEGGKEHALHGEALTRGFGAEDIEESNAYYGDEGFWVGVMPFSFDGDDTNVAALARGLSEDVVAGLSRFSYLRVISSNVGSDARARYNIEGVLRKAGSMIRLAVKVVDGSTGASLWAEKYNVPFNHQDIFDIQDKLAPQIVSTVADMHGVLPRTMGERLRTRSAAELTPYEALVRSFGYFERVTPAEWRTSLDGVEAALEKTPEYATLRAMQALLLVQGYAQGFDLLEESLELGAVEARRAVETSSSDHLAWFALAQALFFKKEFSSLPTAVKRSLALNPMDGNATALFGEMISYSGDWEWGLKLAQTARELNPNFPGWYWHANFNDAYRRRDYQEALDIALRMNLNSNWGAHVLTSMAYGQLGEKERAVRSFEEAAKIRRNLAEMVPRDVRVWFDREHADHLIEGLLIAGIYISKGQSAN